MGNVSSESTETRVQDAAASGDAQVDLSVNSPATSPQNSDATVIAASPIAPQTNAVSAASPAAGETMVGVAPSPRGDGATIISSVDTVLSAAPLRPSQNPTSSNNSGPGGILLEVGTILAGRYELLKLLGQGGMGAVYKAADREVDRVVAIKLIRPEMAANPEILARFKQELLLSSQVTDRNVIRIFDLGDTQGVKFITMEYLEGQDLHTILKERRKLDVAEAVEIMEQVTSGLAAAHRVGIIHRDLKPANIMRDNSGRVVVMDFGLARTFSGDGMTQTGMMLGTMEYMSPEQAQGKDVKASSDIFTVGLILYELLAGITPFHAESAIASLLRRTQERAAPLINVDRNIPGPLSNIVAKCLEKEPANRYQSAEDLLADLRAWQGKSGNTQVSASSPRPYAAPARQLPWPRIAIAGAVVAAIAGGAAWYTIHKRHAVASGAHAPLSVLVGDFTNHTGDPVLDNTLEPMMGVALEGASFINVYSRGEARKFAKKLPNPTDVLDEQSSRLVAMNQGVQAVITGDISHRGDQYDITALALDSVSGKQLAKAELTVPNKQELLSELPKLAVPIRQALGDTTPESVQFEKVSGGFTAASLEAVHQDSLGVDEQFAGKFQEALDSFKKAADLDPKFARAYSGMAAMSNNLGRSADAVKYMKLAMANSDRMTERERYRNQGLYYLTLGEWQNCVQQYTQLVAHYPADRVGQNNLATCYSQLRNAPKALEAATHAVEITPMGVGQRLNLAFIAAFAGDFSTSGKEARVALDISPTASQGYMMLGEAHLGQGRLKDSAESYHQLEKFSPEAASSAADGLADLAAYQGNYAEAARILVQAAATDLAGKLTDNAANKFAALATIDELQGHTPAALSDLGKAQALTPSTQLEMLIGATYVDAGDLPKAQKIAAGLAAQTSSEPQAYGKIIQGLIAVKKKDFNEAVKQIIAANTLLDTWIGRFELGRAYLAAGSFREADAEFDTCLKRKGEAIELFTSNVPTYAWLPQVYYDQGLAREGMKNAAFADSFKQYLAIRGQSTEDPHVAEIRQQLH